MEKKNVYIYMSCEVKVDVDGVSRWLDGVYKLDLQCVADGPDINHIYTWLTDKIKDGGTYTVQNMIDDNPRWNQNCAGPTMFVVNRLLGFEAARSTEIITKGKITHDKMKEFLQNCKAETGPASLASRPRDELIQAIDAGDDEGGKEPAMGDDEGGKAEAAINVSVEVESPPTSLPDRPLRSRGDCFRGAEGA